MRSWKCRIGQLGLEKDRMKSKGNKIVALYSSACLIIGSIVTRFVAAGARHVM